MVAGLSLSVACASACALRAVIHSRSANLMVGYVLSKTKINPHQPGGELRKIFTSQPVISRAPLYGHTHGLSAADRSRAQSFFLHFANLTGHQLFNWNERPSDVRREQAGRKEFHWAKDTQAEIRLVSPGHEHVVAVTDVDYYMDMPSHLCSFFQTHLLYSFTPTQVADGTGENPFTFTKENKVNMIISGGSRYQHHVWDWGHDCFQVTRSIFGVPLVRTVYLLDRKQISTHRSIILLTPLSKWVFPFSVFALGGNTLERLLPVVGEHIRLLVSTRKGLLVSTGLVGAYASITTSAAADVAVAVAASQAQKGLCNVTTRSCLPDELASLPHVNILTDYHRANSRSEHPVAIDVSHGAVNYQWYSTDYDADAKPSLEPFMKPIMSGAWVPMHARSNDKRMVEGRIKELKAADIHATARMMELMQEFSELFVGSGYICPVDFETVQSRQTKPTQQSILRQADSQPRAMEQMVKSFMKREAYESAKDPRNISQINAYDKVFYSRFTYALADLAKQHSWYAFGLTPYGTAVRVGEICKRAESVSLTDFSRMDGRISGVVRDFEQVVLMKAFGPKFRQEILRLHSSQFGLKGRTKHGVTYNQGFSRASGSPETSVLNTLVNAFIGYCALRYPTRHTQVSKEVAFSRLGIYGGDDGLTADPNNSSYDYWAKAFGQVLTTDTVMRGKSGVNFLARVYSPSIWYGDLDSMCDLTRQLSKFHLSIPLAANVTPSQKLLEKCRSFYLMDANTPIIGQFSSKAIELSNADFDPLKDLYGLRSWSSLVDKACQYPNDFGEWMLEELERRMPEANTEEFMTWLNHCTMLEDLLAAPLAYTAKLKLPERPVVVNGEILKKRPNKAKRVSVHPQRLTKR